MSKCWMFTGQISSQARQEVHDHRTSAVIGESSRTNGLTVFEGPGQDRLGLLQEIGLGVVDHLLGRKRFAGHGRGALLLAPAALGAA